MVKEKFVMHNPLTFNIMDLHGKVSTSPEIVDFLTNRDSDELDEENFSEFLNFAPEKQRKGMVETFGMESYAVDYIANQVAKLRPDSRVILSDGKRRSLGQIVQEEGNPKAVFMTSMSSNFPTAVATTIALNHAKIPVVLGGIHVSTSPDDVNTFIRKYAPNPELISQVRGAGDSKILQEVMKDIDNSTLKPDYIGYETMEDGVWGAENIEKMEPMKMDLLNRIPGIGWALGENFKINPITPYLGCPHSCNFCSISTLPKKQRKFQSRSPGDFVDELKTYQENGADFGNRFFFFLPDNLLLGGKTLDKTLDGIIESDLEINYAAQISIDVANDEGLMKKLRQSGATHFFIGMESLDLDNLKYIGKNAVKDIEKKGVSVESYYKEQVGKMQDNGISVHGAFILGLPFDYYNSPNDHTGVDIANFCIDNKIGLQPCSLTDLPGSKNFRDAQANNTHIYGAQGTMDYLTSLCIADLTETNKVPPKSLHESPLTVAYMAYDAVERACSTSVALKNGIYMAKKSWQHPTANGTTLKKKAMDSACAFASQLIVSQYKDHGEAVAHSTPEFRGSFERLYEREQNQDVKKMFNGFVERFK